WFAMLRYEFVVLLMMTSFLLVKGLRIAMMYQGVNVEGLEAYRVVSSGKSHARSSVELIVR
ncbi:MAG: hypothetical protein KBA82_10570, partial [Nitrosomonas sp.]|nr:hypothetical protein [Nitrosomonas sp.]